MHFVRLTPALVGAALLLTGSAHAQAVATTKTTRTYDCTKAGNANKTACKTATAKPAAAPAAATVTRTTTARNYDCSKAGNANKAVCKNAVKPAVAAAAPAAPAPVAPVAATVTRTTAVHTQQTSRTTTTGAAVHAAGPNGATAQCKDGTYSKSTHRAGTCAGHKGVQTWY